MLHLLSSLLLSGGAECVARSLWGSEEDVSANARITTNLSEVQVADDFVPYAHYAVGFSFILTALVFVDSQGPPSRNVDPQHHYDVEHGT